MQITSLHPPVNGGTLFSKALDLAKRIVAGAPIEIGIGPAELIAAGWGDAGAVFSSKELERPIATLA